MRRARLRVVRHSDDVVRQRMWHELCAGRVANTVGRELRKFRIVRSVDAAVRDQQYTTFARLIGEAIHIGQNMLGTGNVQLAIWQHEVRLRVDCPEDHIFRNHLFT